MTTLGVFGGGFKPFTMGHFSMLALAAAENDRVVLLFGLSGRATQGASFTYTPKMAQEIFLINKRVFERTMKNVIVIEARPTPVSVVFSLVNGFQESSIGKEVAVLSEYNIDLTSFERLTVYDGPDDIHRYTSYVNKEIQRFSALLSQRRLLFDAGPGHITDNITTCGHTRMAEHVRPWAQSDETDLEERVKIRGTGLRSMLTKQVTFNQFRRYVPPIYTSEEALEVFNILKLGVKTGIYQPIPFMRG